MKTIAILMVCCFYYPGYETKNLVIHHAKPSTIVNQKIDFKTQIEPILQKRCSPCHFAGAKMYERLPFDTPSSILLKKEIILKRIKDDSENNLIRAFIVENEK